MNTTNVHWSQVSFNFKVPSRITNTWATSAMVSHPTSSARYWCWCTVHEGQLLRCSGITDTTQSSFSLYLSISLQKYCIAGISKRLSTFIHNGRYTRYTGRGLRSLSKHAWYESSGTHTKYPGAWCLPGWISLILIVKCRGQCTTHTYRCQHHLGLALPQDSFIIQAPSHEWFVIGEWDNRALNTNRASSTIQSFTSAIWTWKWKSTLPSNQN